MNSLETIKSEFEQFLITQIPQKKPHKLYQPLKYILENGGKRIRPLLVLLSTKSFGEDLKKGYPAAASIEIFHNFSLIHDDIMDKAEIRRGKPSVHKKWNDNIAILSGDTMMILAFKMLENYPPEIFKKLSSLLYQTAIEVCEGQQLDMDFENRNDVSIDEYVEMIKLKTAVLLGTALQFGGIISNTTNENLNNIGEFGIQLGLAFQIQDDYLDVYGDSSKFGKKRGGDIIDRKKTYLYLTALSKAQENDKQLLTALYDNKNIDDQELIDSVVQIFDKYKVSEIAQKQIERYTRKSLDFLSKTDMSLSEKEFWKNFALDLMKRAH